VKLPGIIWNYHGNQRLVEESRRKKEEGRTMKSRVIFVVSSFFISSFPVKSTPIQSDFLGVGLAFFAHLRFNDVDRQNLPLVDAEQDFYFFEGLISLD
jgi:uncharacterized membrane protein